MNKTEQIDFLNLCDTLIEGIISQEDKQRLESILKSDESARIEYLRYASIHSSLMHYMTESEGFQLPAQLWEQSPASQAAGNSNLIPFISNSLKWAASIAVGILLLSYFWNNSYEQPIELATEIEEDVDEGMAVLMHTYQVDWSEKDTRLMPGDSVPPGKFTMESGIAQLEFYSGATLIIEGKSDLEILSAGEVLCKEGKLSVFVSPQASGFIIRTPDSMIAAQNCEMGIKVAADLGTELNVFAGDVVLQEYNSNVALPAVETLTGPIAVRVESGQPIETVAMNDEEFLNVQQLIEQTNQVEIERFYAWKDYSDYIAQSDGLVRYFPFYQTDPWVRKLENAVVSADESSHGAIVGSRWEQGRWPEKSALRFNNPSDRVRFDIPGNFDNVTFAAWVKVESLKNRFNGLFMTDKFSVGNPHWQITQDGKLQLGIKRPQAKAKGRYQYALISPKIIKPSTFGQWIHLASTFDGKNGQFRHYFNGQLVSENEPQGPATTPIIIGKGELGNWGLRGTTSKQNVRNFDGAIDEVLLYERVLSPEEIAELYSTGHPMPLVSSSTMALPIF